ncbi:efflux RND transporter periplasmic adaptor subunit [Aerolutibacter ruishenii]|uniref:Membrane fusion protein (Multidrug efflux system) n=1 Tax=Aerolutibacter ruishenii TaxID=686800 RepID=A0A562LVK4_9GAMM|nr:efflux RND transporter periplasmic adaptor subunit [Lysobacter ruishenii]TWI11626.1 membrane fusion protein (multidrug efflux system) [Lysobacter ruishenii]
MSRPALRLVPLALSLSLALAACGGAPEQPPASQAVPVTVVTLQPQDATLTRELPGRTTPFLVAEVRPQVSGIVRRRLFTEGGDVKAGQPLYQIDDAAYRADNNNARATLARAQAALVTTRLNAQRSAELVKVDAVSRQDDDNAQAALRQAEADVKAAQAMVDGTGVTLGYARITSPISGRIGKSSVTQGALVNAGQPTPLATVQQLDPIYVDLTQSSTELLALRKAVAAGSLASTASLPVTVLLEDGTPHTHEGKLAFSEVTVDPSTGSFALRVVVPNPDGVLLPGMYVRAVVGNGERKGAILVPQQGIARDPKGHTSAMVVGKDGKAEARPVKVSQAIGDKWLVEDGLKAGDKVIVEGLQKIRPGAPVTPSEAGAPAQAPGANAAPKPATGAGSK